MPPISLGWIQLAVVIGAVQGLFLTAALFAQRNNQTANRLLAVLMGAFTIYLASSIYYDTGLVRTYPHFFGVAYPMPWVFGPLVYLYALAASDRGWHFTRRTVVHAIPIAIVIAVTLPYHLLSADAKRAMLDQLLAGNVPMRLVVLGPTKYISGLAYTIATVLYLRRHGRRIELSYSNTARVNLMWLLWFVGAAAFIWLMATTLPITDLGARLREEHISLAIAILVYAIGYTGLRQPEIFRYEMVDAIAAPDLPPPAPVAPPAEPDEERTRYERSGLDADEAAQIKSTLLAAMDKSRPWRDSELTLADLAEHIGTTPHKLSEVLNGEIGQTFYDFVNGYRVREVQRRIKEGEARRLKMLALAMDAGFASKSTFNQVFKKHTNLTPSDFQASVG